jgi:outer membrane receptor protein involved in Fe transport
MDWFLKKTKDLLISSYTPSTVVGVTASPINAGDVENRGFEFELGWQDTVGDFHYSINANAATLHNEVTYLYEALSNGISGVSYRFSPITRFEKGYPAWHYYGYQFTGIDPTNGEAMFADVNGDGEVTEADKTDIGSGIPKVTYGLTFTAAWKNFDFAIFGSGAAGHQIFSALNRVAGLPNTPTPPIPRPAHPHRPTGCSQAHPYSTALTSRSSRSSSDTPSPRAFWRKSC